MMFGFMDVCVCIMSCCFVLRRIWTKILFFFFFQAEDGIRDHCVTGVQTCALPIYPCNLGSVFSTDQKSYF